MPYICQLCPTWPVTLYAKNSLDPHQPKTVAHTAPEDSGPSTQQCAHHAKRERAEMPLHLLEAVEGQNSTGVCHFLMLNVWTVVWCVLWYGLFILYIKF